jgi:hypothetical protein
MTDFFVLFPYIMWAESSRCKADTHAMFAGVVISMYSIACKMYTQHATMGQKKNEQAHHTICCFVCDACMA